MKNLFEAARVLLLDLASTLLFLALYIATDNLFLAVGLGMALGVVQIGWQLFEGRAGRDAAVAEPGAGPGVGDGHASSPTIRAS